MKHTDGSTAAMRKPSLTIHVPSAPQASMGWVDGLMSPGMGTTSPSSSVPSSPRSSPRSMSPRVRTQALALASPSGLSAAHLSRLELEQHNRGLKEEEKSEVYTQGLSPGLAG